MMHRFPFLQHSLRPLLRRRGTTAIILITLALGVGVNTGIFSIFQQILLQHLPVPAPTQLYAFASPGPKQGHNSNSGTGGTEMTFSYPMWQDLNSISADHQGIAGFRHFGANLAFAGRTVSARGSLVTANFFSVLQLQPTLGRLFNESDYRVAGEGDIAVLAHRYWQRELGEDPDVVGQSLVINGRSMQIIGVAPAEFVGVNRFSPADVFVPVTMVQELAGMSWELGTRNNYWMYMLTRLKPGATPEQLRQTLEPRYRQLLRELDAPLLSEVSDETYQRFLNKPLQLVSIASGQSRTREIARTPMILLLAVTGFVLLVACVNIANLLLALAISDRGDTAVRMALGAGWRQVLARQSTQLAFFVCAGLLASLPVAWLTMQLVLRLLPDPTETPVVASLDLPLLATAAGISALAVALAGLAPLLQTLGSKPLAAIREQSGRAGASRFSSRLRAVLVTGQIALAVALLITSGLFIRSLVNVAKVDLGMQIDQVATFTVSPSQNGYEDAQSRAFFERLLTRLNALPEVNTASMSLVPVLSDSDWTNSVSVEGFDAAPDTNTQASFNAINERFLESLSIPLLAGRNFTAADSDGRPKVAMVNQAFVEKFEMGDEVIGKRMAQAAGNDAELDMEIVGLVADARYARIKEEPPPQYFMPMRQFQNFGTAAFYVRAQTDPASLLRTITQVVAELDPDLPVDGLATMRQFSQQTIVLDRLMGTLASLFAALATILAAVGLFGVLSFSMAQRSGELGLRAALGASPGGLQGTVMRHALMLALIGVVLGLLLALLLGRLASGLLYGIEAFDLPITIAAMLLMFVVVLLAGWLPARRAAAIHPVQALRYE
ncbi:MAG: ABC transporter permease [Gammaproteobacteria bacterium]|nr:ABC transporter permease [Gammaproteobacteria bacterium]